MTAFDRYLPHAHEPNAKRIMDIYFDAHTELTWPAPASHLKRYALFDKMTGGLRPHEFSILCGATGTGKTTLCSNFAVDLMEQNIPHYIASVETGHTDFVKRMISVIAEKDWNTGDQIPIDTLKQFHSRHSETFKCDGSWLALYDDRCPVESLMADLAHMVKNHGIKVAMIDNLNFFLEVTSAQNALIEMDRVIHELIIFCKQIPIHLIMVMHPKKTEHGRVESSFDIKGSSTAVQEAHNVFLFNTPHPDLIKAGTAIAEDREIKISKMRRMGKYVGRRLILKSPNGVNYLEKVLV